MSEHQLVWSRRMTGRDPHEVHRVATPIELLFDLCFVVAVAQAAVVLHHSVVAGHYVHGILGFLQVFFAIWWGWMNFTWFASAYDSGDMRFKLAAIVNIIGALIVAAGVPRVFERGDARVMTAGYALMRVVQVLLWLRASREDEDAGRRKTARHYALGIALCEVGWLLVLLLPHDLYLYGWGVMIPLELVVPMTAERRDPTRWHPHHIIERYSLFTLIVIGESVLSSTIALEVATDAGLSAPLVAIIVGAILVLFSFWWLYFSQSHHHVTGSNRAAFAWGYGHYFIFASLAATGAGIAAATDLVVEGKSLYVASAAVAIPCAVYVVMLWVLCIRFQRYGLGPFFALAIAVLLGSIALPWPVLPAGAVMVALAILNTFVQQKHNAAEHAHGHQHRSGDSGH